MHHVPRGPWFVATLIETLDETILAGAVEGVQSMTVDGVTVVATDPEKLLALRRWAAETTTPPRSAWGRVMMARAVPPGGGPQ